MRTETDRRNPPATPAWIYAACTTLMGAFYALHTLCC